MKLWKKQLQSRNWISVSVRIRMSRRLKKFKPYAGRKRDAWGSMTANSTNWKSRGENLTYSCWNDSRVKLLHGFMEIVGTVQSLKNRHNDPDSRFELFDIVISRAIYVIKAYGENMIDLKLNFSEEIGLSPLDEYLRGKAESFCQYAFGVFACWNSQDFWWSWEVSTRARIYTRRKHWESRKPWRWICWNRISSFTWRCYSAFLFKFSTMDLSSVKPEDASEAAAEKMTGNCFDPSWMTTPEARWAWLAAELTYLSMESLIWGQNGARILL